MSSDRSAAENCSYCGLPLIAAATIPDSPRFCCFGCRFAYQVAAEGGAEGQARWAMTRLGLAIFLTMNVMMFTMALWTEDVYTHDVAALSTAAASSLHQLLRYLCLLLSLPVLLMLGGPLVENAIQQVRGGTLSTDLLIVLGVAASFAYSTASVVRGQGHVYFEVGCVVLLAVTLGRWLEATARTRASRALELLARLLPQQVQRLIPLPPWTADTTARQRREAPPTTHAVESIALADVVVGDRLRILPGERIAVDGRVVDSRGMVDEQVVTGESLPRVKENGDTVRSGSLNLDGDLVVEVTEPPSAGTLQRLIESVRQAAQQRSDVQRLVERIAAWFIPGTALVALVTLLAHGLTAGWQPAILRALAVVLIACPCAIGIATPLALWAAIGRASSAQVLLRSGDALTRLAHCRAICFDKTGTLTRGQLTVASLHRSDGTTDAQVRQRAAICAAATRHVVAQAIQHFVGRRAQRPVSHAHTVPGRGVVVQWPEAQTTLYMGSLVFMAESGQELTGSLLGQARQIDGNRILTALGWDGQVQALFELDEDMRSGVPHVLAALRAEGFEILGLTGDCDRRGLAWGQRLGIRMAAGLLPDDKRSAIRQLRSTAGPVAMVGDGLNDAPALAQADVGIALGCGADVSREAADVCLLGDDLARLPWIYQLARRTNQTIRQNLFWAFAYNVIGIALAAAGYLHPALAALAMVLSSLFVVTNSLRLSRFDSSDWPAGLGAAAAEPLVRTQPLQDSAECSPREAGTSVSSRACDEVPA